jgi:hypothetical protein
VPSLIASNVIPKSSSRGDDDEGKGEMSSFE